MVCENICQVSVKELRHAVKYILQIALTMPEFKSFLLFVSQSNNSLNILRNKCNLLLNHIASFPYDIVNIQISKITTSM